MIKFLLQTVNGEVVHDFVFETKKGIEFTNWSSLYDGDKMGFAYAELEDLQDLNNPICPGVETYCPVGSIDFVFAFIDRFVKPNGSKEVHPLNVPDKLLKFAGRKIDNIVLTDNASREEAYAYFKDCKYIFIKSNDVIKDEINDRYLPDYLLMEDRIPNGSYQVSEYVDVRSEYRCFIFLGLSGIHWYSGDFKIFPNVERIEEMVRALKGDDYMFNQRHDTIPAYTLDVAVLGNGETVVMECHEFFSCGLYGFPRNHEVPTMLNRAFQHIKRNLNN